MRRLAWLARHESDALVVLHLHVEAIGDTGSAAEHDGLCVTRVRQYSARAQQTQASASHVQLAAPRRPCVCVHNMRVPGLSIKVWCLEVANGVSDLASVAVSSWRAFVCSEPAVGTHSCMVRARKGQVQQARGGVGRGDVIQVIGTLAGVPAALFNFGCAEKLQPKCQTWRDQTLEQTFGGVANGAAAKRRDGLLYAQRRCEACFCFANRRGAGQQ